MRLGINGRFWGARVTGVQRFAREISRGLVRCADVTFLMPRGGDPPSDLDGPAKVVWGRHGGRIWEQMELPSAAREAGVDVLLHLANAAPVWGGPNVIVLHDVTPFTHGDTFRPAYRVWARVTHGRAARQAAGVATVSEWSAREIERTTGIPRERIRVVRQGAAPLDRPASDAAIRDARSRFGLASRYFLAVGGGDPRKGRSFLEDLWRSWPSDRSRPELVIVGGSYPQVHSASGAESSSGLRSLGHVTDEELRALYTGSLALVFPTRAEGFGRPILEALACGTRVVTTPYGAVREVLGGAGEVVPPEVPSWLATLRALMDEPEAVRRSKIELGMRHASAYRWEDAVAEILDLCEGVARGPHLVVGRAPEPGPPS